MTYIIKDWAGNVMNWGIYSSEDDAYEDLMNHARADCIADGLDLEDDIYTVADEYQIVEGK